MHSAQTRAGRAAIIRDMAKPDIPATGESTDPELQAAIESLVDPKPADPQAADVQPPGPSTAPATFQALAKLNPGLDPFIFFGF